jgi:hypothetical protein
MFQRGGSVLFDGRARRRDDRALGTRLDDHGPHLQAGMRMRLTEDVVGKVGSLGVGLAGPGPPAGARVERIGHSGAQASVPQAHRQPASAPALTMA